MDPYPLTLNGQFIKEGEDFLYYGYPEPMICDGKREPGFEVFMDCDFLEGIPTPIFREPMPPCYDLQAMGLLFGYEKNDCNDQDSKLIQTALQSPNLIQPSSSLQPKELLMGGERL